MQKVYFAKSAIPHAGRGVFTRENLKKGEIIETCPVIKISQNDSANSGKSILITYFYYSGKNKNTPLLALGYGSLYNHSSTPNAKYKIDTKGKTIEFSATKEIKKDDEITVDYKGSSTNPLWFENKTTQSKNPWHVYILLCSDNSLYTGITKDIKKRFLDHKTGRGGAYTRSHMPVKIVYSEMAPDKGSALKRETEIKKMSKRKKQNLVYQLKQKS